MAPWAAMAAARAAMAFSVVNQAGQFGGDLLLPSGRGYADHGAAEAGIDGDGRIGKDDRFGERRPDVFGRPEVAVRRHADRGVADARPCAERRRQQRRLAAGGDVVGQQFLGQRAHVGVGGMDLVDHQHQPHQRRAAHVGVLGFQHRQQCLVDGADSDHAGEIALGMFARPDRPVARVILDLVEPVVSQWQGAVRRVFEIARHGEDDGRRLPRPQGGGELFYAPVERRGGSAGGQGEIEPVDGADPEALDEAPERRLGLARAGFRFEDGQRPRRRREGGLRRVRRKAEGRVEVRFRREAGAPGRGVEADSFQPFAGPLLQPLGRRAVPPVGRGDPVGQHGQAGERVDQRRGERDGRRVGKSLPESGVGNVAKAQEFVRRLVVAGRLPVTQVDMPAEISGGIGPGLAVMGENGVEPIKQGVWVGPLAKPVDVDAAADEFVRPGDRRHVPDHRCSGKTPFLEAGVDLAEIVQEYEPAEAVEPDLRKGVRAGEPTQAAANAGQPAQREEHGRYVAAVIDKVLALAIVSELPPGRRC